MAIVRMQSPAQAVRERELIKNPRSLVPKIEIREGIMCATVYPTTGAALLRMDTGQSIALTRGEAVALRNLLGEHLPAKETEKSESDNG